MSKEKLMRAREFEQEQLKRISPEERPCYHVTGGSGWINDPNGFSFYKDEYHLFYQYHPYSNEWGPMHWGHVTSKDLITWERLPLAMVPEESYDNFGCFSGSGVELPDGRHLLMYTGVGYVSDIPMANGELPTHQTQCLAVGDGTDYEKYEKNPVITGDDIPVGGSKVDFRDPKIWKDEDGFYYAVVANMMDDGNGRILLFRSTDAFQWQYVCVLDHSDEKLGKMWECPDFYEVDGKHVLVVSPMAMIDVYKRQTLGRLFNVLGETVDGGESLDDAEHWVIHRDPPSFEEQKPAVEILETGIKVIDLLAPYAKGGRCV